MVGNHRRRAKRGGGVLVLNLWSDRSFKFAGEWVGRVHRQRRVTVRS